jgi:hypothetical protein
LTTSEQSAAEEARNEAAVEPKHRLDPPVPVTARIVWDDGGEEYVDTEAVGWSGQLVYAVLDTAL